MAKPVSAGCFPVSTSPIVPTLEGDTSSPITSLFKKHHWSNPPSSVDTEQKVNTKQKREELAKNGFKTLKETVGTGEVKKEIKKIREWLRNTQYARYNGEKPSPFDSVPKFNPYESSHIDLANRIIAIMRLIDTEPQDGKYHQHMQLIRQKIDEAVSMPAYQELEEAEQVAMINFLKHVGYVLDTQTEGMSVIAKIGGEAVEGTEEYKSLENKEQFSAKNLSSILREAIRNTPGHRKETIGQLLRWIVSHLKKAVYGFIDECLPCGHRSYKPYKLDNTFIHIGDYIIGGKKVQFNLGPSVASDQVFEKTHLLFLKKHNKAHYQHSLEQGKDKKGETARSAIQKELAKNNDEFFYWRSPLDGDIWKGKGKFSKIQSVKDYHTQLREQIEKSDDIETGFDLGKGVFTQQDIDEALECSEKAFKVLVPDNIDLNQDENRRLSKAMLLGFTGFLAIRAMQNFGEKLDRMPAQEGEGEVLPSMGEACKQDVDRGVIINAVNRAFVELIDKGSFNKDDISQIVGMIKFRGLQIEDRLILEDRLEAFLDLFDLIGNAQGEFVSVLKEFASKKQPVKFEPSFPQSPST